MIIHNRGWGPQLEDALFVDAITGHYRYRGDGAVAEPAIALAPSLPLRRPSAFARLTLRKDGGAAPRRQDGLPVTGLGR